MSTPGWALGKVPGTHTAPQPACPWCPAVSWPPAWRHASSGCSVTMGGARSLSAWRGGRRGSLRRGSAKHRLPGDPIRQSWGNAGSVRFQGRAGPSPQRTQAPWSGVLALASGRARARGQSAPLLQLCAREGRGSGEAPGLEAWAPPSHTAPVSFHSRLADGLGQSGLSDFIISCYIRWLFRPWGGESDP